MKTLPGYKKVQQTIGFAHDYVSYYPRAELRKLIARATGDLLAHALMMEDVDTTKPIFVDGAQAAVPIMDATEVTVELQYAPRLGGLAELARKAGATESDTEIDLLTDRPMSIDG